MEGTQNEGNEPLNYDLGSLNEDFNILKDKRLNPNRKDIGWARRVLKNIESLLEDGNLVNAKELEAKKVMIEDFIEECDERLE